MIKSKTNIFKPRFKKLNNNQVLLRYKKKILTFKKEKWNRLKTKLLKLSVIKKQNCYYKFYDQQSYLVNRFTNRFSNKFKQIVINKRMFKILFGTIKQKKIKNILKNSKLKSPQKSLSLKHVFNDNFERKISTILVKSYFALNIRNAKQLVTHGHVKVNDSVIKSDSLLVNTGDKINFSPSIHTLLEYRLANNIMWPIIPKHVQISYKLFQIIVIDNSITNTTSNNLEAKFHFDTILN
jgi:small subunit ribosomal protein S4